MTKNFSATIPLIFRAAALFIVIFCLQISIAAAADKPARAAVLKNEAEAVALGNVWQLQSINQAIELFEKTAADWEKLGEPQKAVFCLNETAKLAQINSDYQTAFRALNRAVRLAGKNNLFAEKVISLSLFSILSQQKGDKTNTQKYGEQAFALSGKVNSATAKAYALFSKGRYEYIYGKMSDATAFFEEANAFAQQTRDIFLMSQVLLYVGYSYMREGSPYKAIDKMNLALKECEQFNYQKGKALAYSGIAYLSYFLNEKQKSLEFFKKSGALFPDEFEWLEKARVVSAIGGIYLDFGELELAETHFRQAIAYFDKVNYPFGKITTLTNLADVYLAKNDLDKAKETYESATKLALEIDDKFRLAIIKEGIGNIELRENNYDKAIESYSQAAATYDKIGVKIPKVENLLGNVYEKKQDYAAARRFYTSALTTNERTKDFLQLSENLYNLSRLDARESNLESAHDRIKQSLNLTETLYSDIFDSKFKSNYLSSVFDRYEHFINLLMKMHNQSPEAGYAVEALRASEKSRARLMLENLALSEANFTKDAAPEIVRREKEIRVLLNSKANKLTDLLSQNAEKSATDQLSGEIRELENELENIKAQLKQQSPVYSAIKNPAPFDVADFQQTVLDENSLLLEFSLGDGESYLWLVGKNELSSYVLPPRAEIESNLENLRAFLKERELKEGESVEDFQSRIKQAETKYRAAAKNLSRQLFGQIAGRLGNKRLIIVPDGELHYFPMAALPLPDSETDEPILLTNETIYEPSAQTLTVLAKSRKQTSPTARNLLVFSDPIFTTDDVRFAPENKPVENLTADAAPKERFRFVESLSNLPRLASSKDESETIVDIIGASNTESYSGFRATRENLLNLKADDYQIIHFATHGLTDERHPELSGIVLSRFDERGQKLNELIRIQDIYGLNLNADLVVLSACKTGIGKELKGEGLMSLNNAFLQTGAKSVVASLWKVEDGATLELMKNFYGTLVNERLTPSESLRRAQIKLRENPQYKSPFYWAAFTVQGDFRSVPNLSGSAGFWVYLLPFLPLPLVGFYLYRRKIRVRIKKT